MPNMKIIWGLFVILFLVSVSAASVVVDTLHDLRHSKCNSGIWFQFANRTKELKKAPTLVQENFKDSFGVWLLQHTNFKPVTFESQFPCMEYTSSATLYEKIEINYFFESASSQFSVSDSNGRVIVTVNSSSKKEDPSNLEWETLSVVSETSFLHGIVLTANITSETDYLLIDKISAYPLKSKRT